MKMLSDRQKMRFIIRTMLLDIKLDYYFNSNIIKHLDFLLTHDSIKNYICITSTTIMYGYSLEEALLQAKNIIFKEFKW